MHTLTSTVALGTTEAVESGGPPREHRPRHQLVGMRICQRAERGGQNHLPGSLAQMPSDNPGTMRGLDCTALLSAQPRAPACGGVEQVAEGDHPHVRIAWERGAELVLGASPAIAWASTSATTQQLVLDAEQVGGAGARWQHSAIALLGTNSRRFVVEYAEDSASPRPAVRTWTATARRC